MRKIFLASLAFCFLALVALPAAAAVQEGPHKGHGEKQKEETLEGCLLAAKEEGEFVLTTAEGKEIEVEGNEALAKHVGHKVKLTGYFEDDDGEMVFEVKKIEHLSAGC